MEKTIRKRGALHPTAKQGEPLMAFKATGYDVHPFLYWKQRKSDARDIDISIHDMQALINHKSKYKGIPIRHGRGCRIQPKTNY